MGANTGHGRFGFYPIGDTYVQYLQDVYDQAGIVRPYGTSTLKGDLA